MLMKDRKLCDQNGIEHNTKYFDRGAMFFVLGSAIDVLSYLADWKWFQTNGSFARLGFCLFVFLMLLHFLEWWSTDRATLISYGYNDIMTGVLNRRAFETLQKMFDPSISYGYIMCDINGLKVANDTMGHEAGDELIKGVAACLSDVFGDENVYDKEDGRDNGENAVGIRLGHVRHHKGYGIGCCQGKARSQYGPDAVVLRGFICTFVHFAGVRRAWGPLMVLG
jgi:hypothetical protein